MTETGLCLIAAKKKQKLGSLKYVVKLLTFAGR